MTDEIAPIDFPPAHSWLAYPSLWLRSTIVRTYAGSAPSKTEPIPDDVEVVHSTIPSREEGRLIKTTIYKIKGSKPSGKVLLNWHGSGFILRAPFGEDRPYCAYLVDHLRDEGLTVYDMDYRKAPEHPYPAPNHDAEDAVLHFANLDEVTHISTSGFSAGGNLAIIAAARAKAYLEHHQLPAKVKSLIPVYPSLDKRPGANRTPPKSTTRSGAAFPPWVFKLFFQALCTDPRLAYSKQVSPFLFKAGELPSQITVICGDADPFHDDCVKFVENLNAGNVPTTSANFVLVPDEGHSWDKAPSCPESFEAREKAYEEVVKCIRRGYTS